MLLPIAPSSLVARAPTPAPAPTATPKPTGLARFIKSGTQFFSAGITVDPRIRDEFTPSASAAPDFQFWTSGEALLLGRLRGVSITDYRSYTYGHDAANPVATIGGGGSTIVPSFNAREVELENGYGLGITQRIYVGFATLSRHGNYGYPAISGYGYGALASASPNAVVAPYAWGFYYANAGGRYAVPGGFTALSYRGFHYRTGVMLREPNSQWYLDLGYVATDLNDRTNAPAPVRDGAGTLGIGFRL
jgi:hypothetical protein